MQHAIVTKQQNPFLTEKVAVLKSIIRPSVRYVRQFLNVFKRILKYVFVRIL